MAGGNIPGWKKSTYQRDKMNHQELKKHANLITVTLKHKLLKVIALFPDKEEMIGKREWNDRHVRYALKKIMENPKVVPESVIKDIKRSFLCSDENWRVDKGSKYTFQEEVKEK